MQIAVEVAAQDETCRVVRGIDDDQQPARYRGGTQGRRGRVLLLGDAAIADPDESLAGGILDGAEAVDLGRAGGADAKGHAQARKPTRQADGPGRWGLNL